jgi:hypothetical protein
LAKTLSAYNELSPKSSDPNSVEAPFMKTHPDGRPWEYPWDSWRDGPHFSADYLRRMKPTGDADAEADQGIAGRSQAAAPVPKRGLPPALCGAHHPRSGSMQAKARRGAGSLASVSSFPAESSGFLTSTSPPISLAGGISSRKRRRNGQASTPQPTISIGRGPRNNFLFPSRNLPHFVRVRSRPNLMILQRF